MAYGDSRVTIHMASSLDGYIARADGKPSLFMPAISAHSCMNSYGQRSAISGLLVAVSIAVETDDQAETDRLWNALTTNGGEESHCGWLKDRYGVSWQIYPKRLTELTLKADPGVRSKAMAEMMKQMKIDIDAIEAAVRA